MSDRRCTQCRRLVKGHEGPCGQSCTGDPDPSISLEEMEEMEDTDPAELKSTDTQSQDPSLATTMRELVSQMVTMNVNLTKLVASHSELHDAVGARNFDSVATTSTPRPPRGRGRGTGATAATHTQPAATLGDTGPPAASKQLPIRVGTSTLQIPAATAQAAAAGEYINLCDFLPQPEGYNASIDSEFETCVNTQGVVQMKPKSRKRVLDTFYKWLKAWSFYEGLVLQTHPHGYSQFLGYRNRIQDYAAQFMWGAVLTYDLRFRMRLGEQRSLAFDTADPDLAIMIFNAAQLKPNIRQCQRCKAIDHVVQECPFPAESTLEAKEKRFSGVASQGPTGKQERWYHAGKEGCNLYQHDRCRLGANCKQAHVCKACRGAHPGIKCSSGDNS